MTVKTFVADLESCKTSHELIDTYGCKVQNYLRLICADNEKTKIFRSKMIEDDLLIDLIKVQLSYGKYYNLALVTNKILGESIEIDADVAITVNNSTKYKIHTIIVLDGLKWGLLDNNTGDLYVGNAKKNKPSLYQMLSNNVMKNINNLAEEEREPRKFKRLTDTSKLGYEMNTIVNMNCIQGMKNMGDNCVDFVLTDIPYGEVNDADIERTEANANSGIRVINKGDADELTFDLNEFLEEIHRVCSNSFVVFCGYEQVSDIIKFFRQKGCSTRIIVWEKTSFSPINADLMYTSNIEVGVWARKHNNGVFNAFCKGTVFKYGPGTRKWHPTQKNEELFKELIEDNTNEEYLVFDPCMGSGTTAKACLNSNRNFFGFELSTDYHEKSTEEIKRITHPGMY